MQRIVLISCVSKKLPHKAEARDLYISALFKGNLAYAQTFKPKAVYILSAKYGLVALDQKIDTYNMTLNTMSAKEVEVWSSRTLKQLQKKTNVAKDEFIFLAGARYRKHLLPHLTHYRIPMEGLGIGKQLQYLKHHAKKG